MPCSTHLTHHVLRATNHFRKSIKKKYHSPDDGASAASDEPPPLFSAGGEGKRKRTSSLPQHRPITPFPRASPAERNPSSDDQLHRGRGMNRMLDALDDEYERERKRLENEAKEEKRRDRFLATGEMLARDERKKNLRSTEDLGNLRSIEDEFTIKRLFARTTNGSDAPNELRSIDIDKVKSFLTHTELNSLVNGIGAVSIEKYARTYKAEVRRIKFRSIVGLTPLCSGPLTLSLLTEQVPEFVQALNDDPCNLGIRISTMADGSIGPAFFIRSDRAMLQFNDIIIAARKANTLIHAEFYGNKLLYGMSALAVDKSIRTSKRRQLEGIVRSRFAHDANEEGDDDDDDDDDDLSSASSSDACRSEDSDARRNQWNDEERRQSLNALLGKLTRIEVDYGVNFQPLPFGSEFGEAGRPVPRANTTIDPQLQLAFKMKSLPSTVATNCGWQITWYNQEGNLGVESWDHVGVAPNLGLGYFAGKLVSPEIMRGREAKAKFGSAYALFSSIDSFKCYSRNITFVKEFVTARGGFHHFFKPDITVFTAKNQRHALKELAGVYLAMNRSNSGGDEPSVRAKGLRFEISLVATDGPNLIPRKDIEKLVDKFCEDGKLVGDIFSNVFGAEFVVINPNPGIAKALAFFDDTKNLVEHRDERKLHEFDKDCLLHQVGASKMFRALGFSTPEFTRVSTSILKKYDEYQIQLFVAHKKCLPEEVLLSEDATVASFVSFYSKAQVELLEGRIERLVAPGVLQKLSDVYDRHVETALSPAQRASVREPTVRFKWIAQELNEHIKRSPQSLDFTNAVWNDAKVLGMQYNFLNPIHRARTTGYERLQRDAADVQLPTTIFEEILSMADMDTKKARDLLGRYWKTFEIVSKHVLTEDLQDNSAAPIRVRQWDNRSNFGTKFKSRLDVVKQIVQVISASWNVSEEFSFATLDDMKLNQRERVGYAGCLRGCNLCQSTDAPTLTRLHEAGQNDGYGSVLSLLNHVDIDISADGNVRTLASWSKGGLQRISWTERNKKQNREKYWVKYYEEVILLAAKKARQDNRGNTTRTNEFLSYFANRLLVGLGKKWDTSDGSLEVRRRPKPPSDVADRYVGDDKSELGNDKKWALPFLRMWIFKRCDKHRSCPICRSLTREDKQRLVEKGAFRKYAPEEVGDVTSDSDAGDDDDDQRLGGGGGDYDDDDDDDDDDDGRRASDGSARGGGNSRRSNDRRSEEEEEDSVDEEEEDSVDEEEEDDDDDDEEDSTDEEEEDDDDDDDEEEDNEDEEEEDAEEEEEEEDDDEEEDDEEEDDDHDPRSPQQLFSLAQYSDEDLDPYVSSNRRGTRVAPTSARRTPSSSRGRSPLASSSASAASRSVRRTSSASRAATPAKRGTPQASSSARANSQSGGRTPSRTPAGGRGQATAQSSGRSASLQSWGSSAPSSIRRILRGQGSQDSDEGYRSTSTSTSTLTATTPKSARTSRSTSGGRTKSTSTVRFNTQSSGRAQSSGGSTTRTSARLRTVASPPEGDGERSVRGSRSSVKTAIRFSPPDSSPPPSATKKSKR